MGVVSWTNRAPQPLDCQTIFQRRVMKTSFFTIPSIAKYQLSVSAKDVQRMSECMQGALNLLMASSVIAVLHLTAEQIVNIPEPTLLKT